MIEPEFVETIGGFEESLDFDDDHFAASVELDTVTDREPQELRRLDMETGTDHAGVRRGETRARGNQQRRIRDERSDAGDPTLLADAVGKRVRVGAGGDDHVELAGKTGVPE